MPIKVITSGRTYETHSFDQLPKAQKEWFDYQAEDQGGTFVKYLRTWYDLSQFMRVTDPYLASKGWIGSYGESYFSGVLLKYNEEGDPILGRYLETN